MAGYLRTFTLLAAMTALFGAIGFMLGGANGAVIALLIACAMNFFSYWNSDKIVLRLYRAHEVTAQTGGEYYQTVTRLAQQAQMPQPKIYIIETDQPNAFATGRNPENAAVAATTGLLRSLSTEQVAGVMAHELAHIRNRDTLIMTVTATIAGAISMLANFMFFFGGRSENSNPFANLLVMILAPIAASIVQMAISRSREYEADRIGAEICGHPEWLASALQSIENKARKIDNYKAEDNPATAHMFIINPLHVSQAIGLFSTHPATADRVSRLMKMKVQHSIDGDLFQKQTAYTDAPLSQQKKRGSAPSSRKKRGSVPTTKRKH